jgi:hypothetical protein
MLILPYISMGAEIFPIQGTSIIFKLIISVRNSKNASLELYDVNSTYNGMGYSHIYKQKKNYFEGASIPNYSEQRFRRGLSQSTLSTENRALSTEGRSKTPQKEVISQSRSGTPNQRSRREVRTNVPQPAISNHFLEAYQKEINLDDHLEMRRKYHHTSSSKSRGLQKSHSYNQINSFQPTDSSPFHGAPNQIDYANYQVNQSDYDNSPIQYPLKENVSLARNSSKGRTSNEPKQVYYVLNSGAPIDKLSKQNIFDLPVNKNNKAHQYNFSFTEREFSEMNK